MLKKNGKKGPKSVFFDSRGNVVLIIVLIVRIFFISFVFAISLACGAFFYLLECGEQIPVLQTSLQVKPSLILDDQGNEYARFELDRRTPIAFDALPNMVIKAFLAAEDHSFFSHGGVSVKGIIRSSLINVYHGRVVQGASTITQQVARLIYLTHERTFLRKIKEVVLAIQLERQLTKEQIFELYVNNMYFGRGIYGVQAAAHRFWNKSITDVTLDQAALLASVAKSARYYSPLNAPDQARKRRNVILECMKKLNFITVEQQQEARAKKVVVDDLLPGNPMRLYVQEWIRQWAEQKWGKEALYTKGFKIKTTINLELQEHAERSFAATVATMRQAMGKSLNGGMVSMQASTGKIKTLIGGINFRESQFNRAMQAYRQVGSSFKPILYALALMYGYDMDTVFTDEPIELSMGAEKLWKPKNWNNKFEGTMTLIRALTFSNNMIAIKLLLNMGVRPLIQLAKRFGVTHELAPYPSLALGTAHATTEENAAAFNVFANGGVYVAPYLVEWVKDEWGKKLWEHKVVSHRVLDTKINSRMVKALMCRMKFSEALSKDGWLDAESIGKTGSTNGAATTWFVGATPELTTAVYLGRDDNKPMGSYVFASKTAFPIWLNFMKMVAHTKKHFYFDSTLKEVTIDWYTGDPVELGGQQELAFVPILKE